MTPNERDRFIAHLMAVWPTPKLSDATLVVWHEQIAPLHWEQAWAALQRLVRTSARRPALAELFEAYDAERHEHGDHHVLEAQQCGECDDGWVSSVWGLRRCPNGCQPLSNEQRQDRDRQERAAWERDPALRRRQEALNRQMGGLGKAMLAEQDRSLVTEKSLDAAGVANWRQRISTAVEADEQDGTYRRQFDETMACLRREMTGAVVLHDDDEF